MLRPQVQVLVAAVFSSVLLVQVSGGPHRHMKTDASNLADEKDLANLLTLKFVSELMSARAEHMFTELEEDEMGVREKVMRRHLSLSQRERKAGCRNFFWKTFTSC